MKKVISIVLAVMVFALPMPSLVLAQNIVDQFGVHHWVGGSGGAVAPGFGGLWYGYGQNFPRQTQRWEENRFDVGSTLARNLPWAGVAAWLGTKYLSLKERELGVVDSYAVVKVNGRDILVHRKGVDLYDMYQVSPSSASSPNPNPNGVLGRDYFPATREYSGLSREEARAKWELEQAESRLKAAELRAEAFSSEERAREIEKGLLERKLAKLPAAPRESNDSTSAKTEEDRLEKIERQLAAIAAMLKKEGDIELIPEPLSPSPALPPDE